MTISRKDGMATGGELTQRGFPTCDGKRSQGDGTQLCTQKAGWGTNHAGQGRCKLHGGSARITSGRYSGVKRTRLRELIEQHEADPDPLNTLPELATCRALLEDYINRYDEVTAALVAWHQSYDGDKASAKPRQILDLAEAYRIVAEVTRIAKRIEDVKASNAISRADFYRVMTEMGKVVDLATQDGDVRERIHDGWMEIRLA